MRLIDADAMKKDVKAQTQLLKLMFKDDEDGLRLTDMLYEGYMAQIEKMPTIEPKPQWIPCSERLPEDYVQVLITTKYGIEFGHYDEEEKRWEWLCESGTNYWENCDCVIAWMPLPVPYKGGENE